MYFNETIKKKGKIQFDCEINISLNCKSIKLKDKCVKYNLKLDSFVISGDPELIFEED